MYCLDYSFQYLASSFISVFNSATTGTIVEEASDILLYLYSTRSHYFIQGREIWCLHLLLICSFVSIYLISGGVSEILSDHSRELYCS